MEEDYPPKSPFTTPLELSLVELVYSRCEGWRSTVTSIIDYFQILLELERQKERSYRKAAALLGPSHVFVGNDEDGGNGSASKPDSPAARSSISSPRPPVGSQSLQHGTWLVPLQAVAIKGNGESESIVRFMEKAMLSELGQLKDAIKMGTKSLREQLGLILTPLHRAFGDMQAAMAALQSAWNSLLPNTRAKDVRSEDGSDPWMLQVRLALRVQAFLAEKSAFAHALQSVHDKQRGLDSAWSATLQKILREFFTIAGRSALQMGEQMTDLATHLFGLDNTQTLWEGDWQSALQRHRLDYRWQLDVPPFDGLFTGVRSEIEQLLSHRIGQDFGVAKAGFLLKQSSSTFGTSKSWHPFFFVLTDSGFLHGYNVGSVESNLSQQLMSHKALQDLNSQVVLYREAFLPEPFLESPHLSIWLGGGQVAATMPSSSGSSPSRQVDSSGCTFQVHSGPVASGGFLFGGRGEKRYTLQSVVEEDMVDWIIAIKQVIERVATSEHLQQVSPLFSEEATTQQPDADQMPHVEEQLHDQPPNYPSYESYNQSFPDASTYQSSEYHSGTIGEGTSASSSTEYKLPPELERNPWED